MLPPPLSPLIGFMTLFQKECARFFAVFGQTIISPLISASLFFFIFGINLAERIAHQNNVGYLPFIIPGLLAMGLLNNAFENVSSSITISKFYGDLQDLKVAPMLPLQITWAYAMAATCRGMIVAFAIGVVGEVFYFAQYGTFLPIYHAGLLAWFLISGGITFGFFGLSVAMFAKTFSQINAVSTFAILPLIYLGGVFFSLENMPVFWKIVSYANPLLYLINGIRYSFLGVSDIAPSQAFWLSVVFLAGTYLLAHFSLKHGHYTRF